MDNVPALAPDSRIDRALISLITENGFEIVRFDDLKDSSPSAPGQHCFVVRAPNGDERDITVEFAESAIALIQRRSRIPLPPSSSSWIESAERSLGTYLWQRTQFPPRGRLIIDELCLNELAIACGGGDDAMPDQPKNKSRNILSTRPFRLGFYIPSLIAILSLYFISALAPKFLAPYGAHLRDSISGLILYTAIFLSGTLAGLVVIDLHSGGAVHKVTMASSTNGPDRKAPSSYDEEGRTPVERVIHRN